MREIKYRIWDFDKKEMIYPDDSTLIVLSNKGNYYTWDLRDEPEIFTNIELMQYTGLRDKNGKEIFEGDIVHSNRYEINKELYVIKYISPAYYLINEIYNLESIFKNSSDFEIIGNKFENHELLEKINVR